MAYCLSVQSPHRMGKEGVNIKKIPSHDWWDQLARWQAACGGEARARRLIAPMGLWWCYTWVWIDWQVTSAERGGETAGGRKTEYKVISILFESTNHLRRNRQTSTCTVTTNSNNLVVIISITKGIGFERSLKKKRESEAKTWIMKLSITSKV